MEVKCIGCGKKYYVKNNVSFVCSLCGTLVEPRGRTAIQVPPEAGSSPKPPAGANPFARTPFEFESCPGGLRVAACLEELSDAVIPDRWRGRPVVEIGDRAFRGQEIQSLKLPASVRVIGDAAFENCYQLQRVEGGAQGMRLGERAFQNCVQLCSVEFPGAADAAISAFAGCYRLGVANENANYRREE